MPFFPLLLEGVASSCSSSSDSSGLASASSVVEKESVKGEEKGKGEDADAPDAPESEIPKKKKKIVFEKNKTVKKKP